MFPDDSQKNSHKSFKWMVPFCQTLFGLGMSSDWSIEQILYVAKIGPFMQESVSSLWWEQFPSFQLIAYC